MNLEELGFTKEELRERVIERATQQLLRGVTYDEDGIPCDVDSGFSRKMEQAIQKNIDTAIDLLAEKHVLPNMATHLETLLLQETNRWGEKIGQPVTFIEYLVKRAEAYMQEQVNYQGKSKSEDSYGWQGTQTRITYLVNQHLQYSIETAMKEALKNANSQIANGIAETVKLQLQDLIGKVKPVVLSPR